MKFKFAINMFFASMLVFIVIGCGDGGMNVYKNDEFGMQISYPQEWSVTEEVEGGAVVMFLAPQQTALDIFQENVNIAVADISHNPMTLGKYTRTVVKQTMLVFKNAKMIVSQDTKLAGLKARQFIYELPGSDGRVTMMHVWTLKDNVAYTVTYTSVSDDYEEYLPLVKKMIKSFKIN